MTHVFNGRTAVNMVAVAAISFTTSGCVSGDIATRIEQPAHVVTTSVATEDPYVSLYAKKGAKYKTVVEWSYYNAPIVENGQLRGNSRIWGDATQATQRASINAIRAAAKRAYMTADQEAMVLAIAYVESGFNPDAAAGTTSAQGLGQFIRKTGEAYGLTNANRWDVQEQARALVEHTLDNYAAAKRAGLGDEYVYARHHDGSFTNNYGGVDLARSRVLPMLPKIEKALAAAQ
ncbi:transglycosylase SLT domain-containing protein [Aestuariibius insulae]|uniref:lytic transglycosylase domain-containing protein n=1 Tax=Aestuariibius insulae TaxID=2058287 RepID=UPI00345EF2EE